jgi:hypothetical protein
LKSEHEHPDRRDIPPVILIILLAFTLFVVIDNQNDIQDSQGEIKEVASQTRDSILEACERGNESRQARLKNYRQDINALKADIALVSTFANGPSVDEYIVEKKKNIRYKERAITEEIASISEVRTKNNEELVDCEITYPEK